MRDRVARKPLTTTLRLVLLGGAWLGLLLAPGLAASAQGDPVFVGAGDIADCAFDGGQATAALLDTIVGTVFTAGDNAYPNGSTSDYTNCYDLSWGRHKARTRPAPGNHEYVQPGAGPYFTYFGASAGTAGLGYYSFDLGAWHIISLNSNINASAGSPQEQWLRADLAANPNPCMLAIWHHPLFTSGNFTNYSKMQDIWQALYEFHADVVISGHDHDYERFAPQSPSGTADPTNGIREFVVGTGGGPLDGLVLVKPNSQIFSSIMGVLKLTLHSTSYDWQFIPIAGQELHRQWHRIVRRRDRHSHAVYHAFCHRNSDSYAEPHGDAIGEHHTYANRGANAHPDLDSQPDGPSDEYPVANLNTVSDRDAPRDSQPELHPVTH